MRQSLSSGQEVEVIEGREEEEDAASAVNRTSSNADSDQGSKDKKAEVES